MIEDDIVRKCSVVSCGGVAEYKYFCPINAHPSIVVVAFCSDCHSKIKGD